MFEHERESIEFFLFRREYLSVANKVIHLPKDTQATYVQLTNNQAERLREQVESEWILKGLAAMAQSRKMIDWIDQTLGVSKSQPELKADLTQMKENSASDTGKFFQKHGPKYINDLVRTHYVRYGVNIPPVYWNDGEKDPIQARDNAIKSMWKNHKHAERMKKVSQKYLDQLLQGEKPDTDSFMTELDESL